MATRWLLNDLLQRHGVTAYALSQKTHGKLSRNAVYRLTGKATRFDLASIDALVLALRELTGEDIMPSDLFGWSDARQESAGDET